MAFTLDYLAGFIDGEGTITLQMVKCRNPKSLSYSAVVKVPNTNPVVLRELLARFGGNLYPVKPRKVNHKTIYVWELRNDVRCLPFLRLFAPLLHLKRKQANIIAHFIEMRLQRKRKLRSKRMLITEQLAISRIRALNRRGV